MLSDAVAVIVSPTLISEIIASCFVDGDGGIGGVIICVPAFGGVCMLFIKASISF